jgi:pilus assembly protein CpaF
MSSVRLEPDELAAARRIHRKLIADGERTPGPLPDRVRSLVRQEAPLAGPDRHGRLVAAVLAEAAGLGPLEPLLADPAVTEVMVNGPGRLWIEREGRLLPVETDLDAHGIEHLIEKVVAPLGLRIDRASPLVDARLPDGSRVNAVVPPLAVDGPCLTIRRFGARTIPLAAFCDRTVEDLLTGAVRERRNIVVSGGTGAGKTTLLNALATAIPATERVITVEDAAELRLGARHVVRLEARPANAEGVGAVQVRDLVRNALRMRPDRIIVGECRGPEALDMLQAMNTGHEGSLSTCHANGPADAVRRLETMVLMGAVALPLAAIRDQVASSIDLIVQVGRAAVGRRVIEVAEVAPELDHDGRVRLHRLAGPEGVEAAGQRPPRCEPRGGASR